jgi:hypothetical protein
MKLMLGFESLPYTVKSSRTRAKLGKGVRIAKGYGEGKTSAEVAKELEEGYNLVDTFYLGVEDELSFALEEFYGEAIEDVMMMEKPPKKIPSNELTKKIEEEFRQYLQKEEHGIHTLAAKRGVSHLLPQPYSRKNPPRPSFIDTGLYMKSFRAWFEEGEEE